MKKAKVILASVLAGTMLCSLAACNNTVNYPTIDEDYVFGDLNQTFTTYDNKDYNEYVMGDDVAIDLQWEGYGIGDPFVMRFDGRYYMYVSSLNYTPGVRAYVSNDLVSWTPCTGAGLPAGFVSIDPATEGAYAPEVYYFNGKFYMYTSPGGKGHYVFVADKPEGPFERVSENLGMSIDGSVFIDDDESMIFMYADGNGVRAKVMNSMTEFSSRNKVFARTSVGGWTEGPYMMKKDGIYYLTYTGNSVISEGYRISYSTSTLDSLINESNSTLKYDDAFQAGINNPIALTTEGDFRGLGHSSSVMGPDMDSYYIAYHTLNSVVGPNRSFAIDRLLFNGAQMSVATRFEDSVAPKLPAFYATGADDQKFTMAAGMLMSKETTAQNFTAEFNVSGGNPTFYVGYVDQNNNVSVNIDYTAKKITLTQTENGTAKVIAEGTLKNDFSALDHHTVRVAHRDGLVDVVFDNMTKINNASLTVPAGKIAYGAGTYTVGYTAFSNVAMGMSDEQEVKQSETQIGASLYVTDTTYSNGAKLSTGSGVKVVEEGNIAGVKVMDFAKAFDYASYYVNFDEDGYYGIEMIYEAADGGKKVAIRLDQGNVMVVELPKISTVEKYVQALVTEFEVTKGAHAVRIEGVSKGVTYASFRFVKTSKDLPSYSAPLTEYASLGSDYKTIWRIENGGHFAQAGTRQLVYFGNETLTDFTLSVDMKFIGSTGTSTAGLLLRAGNYAAASNDTYKSIQGYYVNFNNNYARLDSLNFAADTRTSIEVVAGKENPFRGANDFLTVKVRIKGNTITVWADGKELYSYTDDWAFAAGKIGLYTDGAAVVYKNLVVTPA